MAATKMFFRSGFGYACFSDLEDVWDNLPVTRLKYNALDNFQEVFQTTSRKSSRRLLEDFQTTSGRLPGSRLTECSPLSLPFITDLSVLHRLFSASPTLLPAYFSFWCVNSNNFRWIKEKQPARKEKSLILRHSLQSLKENCLQDRLHGMFLLGLKMMIRGVPATTVNVIFTVGGTSDNSGKVVGMTKPFDQVHF
ncbi:hypothetical protein F2Q70_00011100 [Brassica cretica]|uniref:Uncharacterized protein n=1 Tax=Brassica cretica TaxID=69181 RepID=A0A8S9MFI7_BRACR|nr:hypothetical protein F2Q70_00011100 [Brassica cretica]